MDPLQWHDFAAPGNPCRSSLAKEAKWLEHTAWYLCHLSLRLFSMLCLPIVAFRQSTDISCIICTLMCRMKGKPMNTGCLLEGDIKHKLSLCSSSWRFPYSITVNQTSYFNECCLAKKTYRQCVLQLRSILFIKPSCISAMKTSSRWANSSSSSSDTSCSDTPLENLKWFLWSPEHHHGNLTADVSIIFWICWHTMWM